MWSGDFQTAVYAACSIRNEEWAEKISGRLEYARDLHASDAVYHNACNVNFRNGKQIPSKLISDDTGFAKRQKVGPPADTIKTEAFLKVANFLEEHDDEQLYISDLVEKMGKYLCGTGESPYSNVYMKARLEEYFRRKMRVVQYTRCESHHL